MRPSRTREHRTRPRIEAQLARVLALVFLALTIPALSAPSALAAPGGSNPSNGGLAPLSDEIAAERAKAREVRAQVEALDTEISMLVEEYDQAVYFLERAEADEQAAAERVEKARGDLEIAQERLLERLSNVYKSGPLGVLDILFGGDDLGGFTQRLRYFQDIAEGDKEFRDEVAERRAALESEREALTEEREKRTSIAAELEDKRSEVEARLGERRTVLASVESDLAALMEEDRRREEERARIAAEEAEKARRAAEEAATRRAAAATSTTSPSAAQSTAPDEPSSPSTPATTATPKKKAQPKPPPVATPPSSSRGGKIIEVANQYLGVPYVWAGESPSGFDCSGLTKYVFAKVGVSLPHSSRLQFQMGTPVSRSNLEPGDLVFFGNPVHHVGIYAGGGQYVHAPYTGEVVKYSPFNRSDFAGARRF